MPFINIQVSDELYRHARLAAARRQMSVSALLRALLLTIDQQPGENPDGEEFQKGFQPLSNPGINPEKNEMLLQHSEKERNSMSKESRFLLEMLQRMQTRGMQVPPIESLLRSKL